MLPFEVLYSPTPPYPVNSSVPASSSPGVVFPSKMTPDAKSVDPRKSRRVIGEFRPRVTSLELGAFGCIWIL